MALDLHGLAKPVPAAVVIIAADCNPLFISGKHPLDDIGHN